ncbi:uncharacterized protein EAE98_002460 [Botrytis deweyae]|uniref:2EXR domain-containing protein n=1 Tax=Botrytis deweyae TaxID=2478750 RepID=A0ABQ7IXB6_9HELO|nr:uncharacterized protein EAE98_002460 [Botrytis deweyae]KAF7936241.1 hypothetical protein EAE98_002460 [Botrytis deweyae]
MATKFTKFPELPLELQRKIWRFCVMEDRVMELDCPDADNMSTKCIMKSTSHANAQQPAYSLVCHEARDAAFQDGGHLWNLYKLWKAKGFDQKPDWEDPCLLQNPWFNPGKDILHLNWRPGHAEGWGISSDDSPHRTLIAYAKTARGGSFMADLVADFIKPAVGMEGIRICARPSIGEIKRNFPLIEQMNGFKVCLTVITIHATAKQVVDAQLFGSSAAPVQLVETSDRETIRCMYKLWLTTFLDDAKLKDPEPEKIFEEMIFTPDDFEARVCKWHEEYECNWLWYKWTEKYRHGTLNSIDSPRDVWTGPDFNRIGRLNTGLDPGAIWMPDQDFNRAHPWVRSILDEMPRFHPVIMFRFCEAKCYDRPPYAPPMEVHQIAHLPPIIFID